MKNKKKTLLRVGFAWPFVLIRFACDSEWLAGSVVMIYSWWDR